MIKLDEKKFELIKKVVGEEMCEKETLSKDEVRQMMNSLFDYMYDMVMSSHEYTNSRLNDVVSQLNHYIEEHSEGHLPHMDKTQVKTVLDRAGILEDFEEHKEPLEHRSHYVFASIKDIKIDVK